MFQLTEILTLFSTAKALGFDLNLILSMMVIALMLLIFSGTIIWKLTNPMKIAISDMSRSFDKLVDTVTNKMEFISERIAEGDKRFKTLEHQIEEIKRHIGLDK